MTDKHPDWQSRMDLLKKLNNREIKLMTEITLLKDRCDRVMDKAIADDILTVEDVQAAWQEAVEDNNVTF